MAANFWTSSHSKLLLDPAAAACLLHDADDRAGLTPLDARLIKLHMCDHLSPLAHSLKLRQRVVATAVCYFRRLYMSKSLMEFDPRLSAPVCLYLAAKAEESTVQAKALVHRMNSHPCMCGYGAMSFDMKDVLTMEMRLLQALSYNLVLFHPYKPLSLFLSDAVASLSLAETTRMDLSVTAWSMVNDSLRTDICLCYPPYITAIASLFLSSIIRGVDLQQWLLSLTVDMQQVHGVMAILLDLYENFTNLPEERIAACVSKLPVKLP